MAITADAGTRSVIRPPGRTVQFGNRRIPVLGPSIRDPRIHLAFTILSIIAIGMIWLDFRLSIPQLLGAMLACGLIEVARTYRASGMLVWPASALQTATSTALILRVTGAEPHDWWSFDGWYYFVGVATAGLLSKYWIRYQGRHIFNPSNIALVVAFLVLGAERIEPLDFWWGPFGWAMLAAYAVIFIGGISLCGRLDLIEMATAFWVTFAIGVGVLAALGQSITTQWSLTPISGAHFWWILVSSPETLIFLFFMITDPRTTPTARLPRIVFGAAVGVVSTILLAPWPTEFGAKVGLLSGLVVVCAGRPLLEHRIAARSWNRARLHPLLGGLAVIGCAALIVAVIGVAGRPNRSAAASAPPAAAVSFDVDPAAMPAVTIDPEVAGLSAELATQEGAQELAADLAFNLRVEAEAMLTGDATLLPAVDHGRRLDDMQAAIEQATGLERVVPMYIFDTLDLSIVHPGGAQAGANAGLSATGTVRLVTYSPDGHELATAEEPFETTFSLREFASDRWLTTDTPATAGDD